MATLYVTTYSFAKVQDHIFNIHGQTDPRHALQWLLESNTGISNISNLI